MNITKDLFNARFVLASNRMAWIDYTRGICIILVCYRHCFEGLINAGMPTYNHPLLEILNVCFYSFRMPLFFIISGLFVSRSLGKKSLGSYVDSRFRIVFYPLIIWGSVQITLQLVFKDYVNADRRPEDYLNLLILPRKIEQFWYLNALFFVGALYAVCKIAFRFNKLHQFVLGLVFFAIASYLNYHENSFFFIKDVMFFYIYFVIGDIIAPYIFDSEIEDRLITPRWLAASSILFIITQTIFTITNIKYKEDNHISQIMPYWYLLISLSGCLFIIQLALLLQRTRFLKWLRVIGYHSLYIYLLHVMIIATVRVLMVHVLHINSIPAIITVAMVTGVIIPVIIYNIFVRLGLWWLFSMKKPTDEINFHSQAQRQENQQKGNQQKMYV